MTECETRLLRALCRSDHMAYIPEGSSTTALREFDDLVLALYGMKKIGWIELAGDNTLMGGSNKVGGAARHWPPHSDLSVFLCVRRG